MKKPDGLLKEYTRRLSDEDLQFLYSRLNQMLAGDLADVLNFLSYDREIDRWLNNAQSVDELYASIDLLHSYLEKEAKKLVKEQVA